MSSGRFLEGFIVGGVLGYLFGILSAPKAGRELRDDLAHGSDELYRQASDSLTTFKDRAGETLDDYKHRGEEAVKKASQSIEEQKSKISTKIEKLTGQAAEVLVEDSKPSSTS